MINEVKKYVSRRKPLCFCFVPPSYFKLAVIELEFYLRRYLFIKTAVEI